MEDNPVIKDKLTYVKAKDWNGEDLVGNWHVTIKIDGIRAICRGNKVLTRKGEPVYGIDNVRHLLKDGYEYELCPGNNFDESSAICRTKDGSKQFKPEDVFQIYPTVTESLYVGVRVNPTKEEIKALLDKYNKLGYEGLVLRNGSSWIKVKPFVTYDVPVIGLAAGKGKHDGKLGAFITPRGRVGTGFTDAEREEFFNLEILGSTIEVRCLELTKYGYFRLPRFVRMRYDK